MVDFKPKGRFSNRADAHVGKMKLFRRIGVFFVPVHLVGWILVLLAIGYSVWSFIDIDSRSHSASDTLINTTFNALIAAVVYSLIAFIFSNKEADGG